MARTPTPTAPETDWEKNGMTEAEWDALSPAAQTWRREHPRTDDQRAHPSAGTGGQPPQARSAGATGPGHASRQAEAPVGGEHRDPPVVAGAQVILTGDAKAAARGDLHGTIEDNAAARDAAIADGHVAPDTAPTAVAETLAASVGSSVEANPQAALDARQNVVDRARAGGEALKK